MNYLLDSDIISIFYDVDRGDSHIMIRDHIALLADQDKIQTSVLVLYELEYSYSNAPDDKKQGIRNTIESVKTDFDGILPISEKAAFLFGELKAYLKRNKNLDRKEIRKHNIDIAVASTALTEGSTIVSGDKIYQEFNSLKSELTWENWLRKK